MVISWEWAPGNFLSISYGELARRPPTRITLLSSSKKGERIRRLLFLGIRFLFPISWNSAKWCCWTKQYRVVRASLTSTAESFSGLGNWCSSSESSSFPWLNFTKFPCRDSSVFLSLFLLPEFLLDGIVALAQLAIAAKPAVQLLQSSCYQTPYISLQFPYLYLYQNDNQWH